MIIYKKDRGKNINLDELEKLNDLKEKGIITNEEFNKQKEKILNESSENESSKTEVNGKDNIVINNNINLDNKKTRKVGLLTVLGYIVGAILIISSIFSFTRMGILSAIFQLLSGIVIFTLVNDTLEKKFNFKLSRVLRIIMFIIFLAIATSTNKTKLVENNNPSSKQNIK